MPDGQDSYAVLAGIRQVSKKRLKEMIGASPTGFLTKLDEALELYLKD